MYELAVYKQCELCELCGQCTRLFRKGMGRLEGEGKGPYFHYSCIVVNVYCEKCLGLE